MTIARVLAAVLLCAGCSASTGHDTLTLPTPAPSPPSPRPNPTPSFATPQAAMSYLADAWNRRDLVSLKHVTDPSARVALDQMHSEATNLRLDHCAPRTGKGDYECYFTHDFPKGYKSKTGHGTAEFTVGPARRSGWYMTVFVGCGG